MLRADFATSETYRYEPLPPLSCPLTVLGGISDPTTTRDELRAWAVHASDRKTVRMFDGRPLLYSFVPGLRAATRRRDRRRGAARI